MKHVGLIAGGAVASVAVASVVAFAVVPTASPIRSLTQPPVTLVGRRMSRAETLERFANSPSEYRMTVSPESVPGARRVPIVEPTWTPLAASQARGVGLASAPYSRVADAFAAFRQSMADAGRGDEDPRCAFWLYLKETAWGRSCWGRNTGNRKAREHANPATIRAGYVYTTNPFSDGIHLLVDLVRSFDSYRTFPTFAASFRDEKRLFEAPNYAGVLPAYRAGGLDGLKAAITAMHRGGYSPGVLPAKVLECDQYWAMLTRRLGAGFAR